MTKFIAKNRIEHGAPDKNGKNVVVVIDEGKSGDLPEDVVSSLVASGAAELPGAAPAEKPAD